MNEHISRAVLAGRASTAFLMFFFWIYQVRSNNAGVIDIGWALSLVILAGIYSFTGPGFLLRKLIIFTLVALWGLRLSLLLIRRMICDKEEDKRYQRIRAEWGKNINFKFFFLFEFQALLAVVLSVPFLIVSFNEYPHILAVEWLGLGVWLVGFAGETIADKQMYVFKSNPENKGKICQKGLWNYSRHPNYFFEWVIWSGYFVFALGSPYGWISVICPVIMFYFLTRVTGIPFAEAQALRSKGNAYRQYQKTTSFFIPMSKRKVRITS